MLKGEEEEMDIYKDTINGYQKQWSKQELAEYNLTKESLLTVNLCIDLKKQ